MVVEHDDAVRDPCGYVTVPPSVVVKVTGTGRNDINGLLGIVISFNVERERYLVHMTRSQSTMVLKKEHLSKANIVESYRAQVEQLRNDARVREKMSKYLNLCRQFVAPLQLSHVVGGALAVIFGLVYVIGFLRTIVTTSLITLIGTIAAPDVTSGPQAIFDNFPERARTVIEKQIPILRGKLTNRQAVGAILVMVALCAQSLVFAGGRVGNKPRRSLPRNKVIDTIMLERFYNLGYEDAVKGRHHGSSLLGTLESLNLQMDGTRWENIYKEESGGDKMRESVLVRLMNLRNIASLIYLYRSVVELGTDQSTNLFSVGQLAANVQHHTEWWRKALLLLSMYNVLRIFV